MSNEEGRMCCEQRTSATSIFHSLLIAHCSLLIVPSDLTRRPELIGREVTVEDRVQGSFQFHRGIGFDEIHLQRTKAILRLPPSLSFAGPPKAPVVRVRGILRQEGDQFVVD